MITIEKNKNLKLFNTFGIAANAQYFCCISSVNELKELQQHPVFKTQRRLVLGGGSNVLLCKDFDGLVVLCKLKGIHTVREADETITLEVASGEVWHDFVLHCVKNNWGGIENLSLIPGTTGAAPIQNIGAYGVEVKDVIEYVNAIDMTTGENVSLNNQQCKFGYRESRFKHEWREKYFISSVTLTLTKKNHRINMQYGAIADTLKKMNVSLSTIQTVCDAVIAIRRSKLPDPAVIGNAGSFFKNPSITLDHYQSLQKNNPTIPNYPSVNQEVKVPAGWLIEQCGWKGKKLGNVGVHAQQALVLVNYGNAKGEEIFLVAMKIIESVKEKFNIVLTPEVNIIV
ncbi:MAG: UDP-N-acetylmuramate dehydrogenase [Cytophagales bacterium]